jgi:hypothetical protein
MRKPAPEKDIMQSKRQELKSSGMIEIWVNDEMYGARQFKGKKQRSSIIEGWLQTLGKPLEPRKIYIIVKPMHL